MQFDFTCQSVFRDFIAHEIKSVDLINAILSRLIISSRIAIGLIKPCRDVILGRIVINCTAFRFSGCIHHSKCGRYINSIS